jgi:hypothetical protein
MVARKPTRTVEEQPAATMEQRLAISSDIRDFTNLMRETLTRIERMVLAFGGMAEGEQAAMAGVLTADEVAELGAMANLAQLFVLDVRAAAPTFLPGPTSVPTLP